MRNVGEEMRIAGQGGVALVLDGLRIELFGKKPTGCIEQARSHDRRAPENPTDHAGPEDVGLQRLLRRPERENPESTVLRLPSFEKTDVRLAFEPLSPKATNFLRTAAEAVRLVKMIDSPRCRLILDCNAMASESTPIPELVRKYRSHLVHFHANDPNRQGPGFGDLDFVPIFKALREIEFAGWVSVEVFDYKPGPERLARESVEYMKKCLAQSGLR